MHIFRVSFNVASIVQSLILVVDSRPRRATVRIGWWWWWGETHARSAAGPAQRF